MSKDLQDNKNCNNYFRNVMFGLEKGMTIDSKTEPQNNTIKDNLIN